MWRVASPPPRPAAIRYAALGLEDVALNATAPPTSSRRGPAGRRRRGSPARRCGPHAPHGPAAFHRTLKVARTIADLDGAADVGRIHLAEALSYPRCTSGSPPDAMSTH